MFTGRKLPITLVFIALLGLAFGVSCNGFFVDPTLTGIAVSPTAPQVEVGKTITLQAFGTYDDGSRKQVKSGVSWSAVPTSVATVDTNTGVLTGVAPGSSTVTASAQALSGTATATVIVTGVTAITVDPTSGSVTKGGSPFTFTFTATANGAPVQITTDNGGVLTITPSTTNVTCSASNGTELCSADSNATSGASYDIKMTYPGSSAFATAKLIIN
jgi:hypothetical protein